MSRKFSPRLFAAAAYLLAGSAACHAASTEKILYNFTGGADGGLPYAGLTKVGTTFYGTTTQGGAYGHGTVFSLTENGTYSVLYSFKGHPDARDVEWPMLYKGGALYGVSFQGGEGTKGDNGTCKQSHLTGCGTVFSVSLDGQETIMHAFSNTEEADGYGPVGTLVAIGDKFYGVTNGGGRNNAGTVFSVTKSGREKVLYAFPAQTAGLPLAGLSAMNGVLYGTTNGHTDSYCIDTPGEVFSITRAGVFAVLHAFGGAGDGACPFGPLLPLDGALYGTTEQGGAHSSGVIYTVTVDGTESVITTLDRYAGFPSGNLVAEGKQLYSLARSFTGHGSLFKSAIGSGKFKAVYKFAHAPDGSYPAYGLISAGGSFYGTTREGGTSKQGTIFEVTP